MKPNAHRLQKFPKSRTKTLIHPWVWTFFVSSTLIFISFVFLTTGTSHAPTFSSVKEAKEKLLRLP